MVYPRLFWCWFYGMSAVLIMACVPFAWVYPAKVRAFYQWWGRLTAWGLKTFMRVEVVVRGLEHVPPSGPVLLACKHQSAAETAVLFAILPRLAPVIKQELLKIPFAKWFVPHLGAIPLNRHARKEAVQQLVQDATQQFLHGRQVLIFPEGTRRPINAPPRYQRGVVFLQQALKCPCIPVALNTGVFWSHQGRLQGNGKMIFGFLPAIAADVPAEQFLSTLEYAIEPVCARLQREGTHT